MTSKYDYDLDISHFAHLKVVVDGEVKMPISAFTILRYLDENGDECIYYNCEGDAALPRTLGMIEWAKSRLAKSAFDPDDEDD